MSKLPFLVIILSGEKQSGKDTAANYISKNYRFLVTSYAYELKKLCLYIMDKMGLKVTMDYFQDGDKKEWLVQDKNGKPFVFLPDKKDPGHRTYREILQFVGTECFRDNIHQNIWVDIICNQIHQAFTAEKRDKLLYNQGMVISDGRFLNEFDATKEFCSNLSSAIQVVVIKVNRKSVKQTKDNHSSETSLKDFEFDHVIENNGTLECFYTEIDKVMGALGIKRSEIPLLFYRSS